MSILDRLFAGAERRRFARQGLRLRVVLEMSGRRASIHGKLQDISVGGCLVEPDGGARLFDNPVGTLVFRERRIPCIVVNRTQRGYHCRWDTLLSPEDVRWFIQAAQAKGK